MKTNKEKDIWAMFNELNSMLYEVMGDFNKAWAENIELKKEVAWFKKYTDALVEHKDMVCLPADLKNLRESNAALATENEELKKKVKELTRPEPTEEELNSLFMDKQVIPDEQDMYLNPEKHTGGDKTKKDIEFKAEMLVKSVQDYADSLNNESNLKGSVSSPGITGMNLKEDESMLKYFGASTGKWYNAVLMQKDPEILALKDPEPKLKSINEHNNRFTKEISFSTGIACPKCGSELMYVDQNLLLSSPPQRRVQCSKCNHIDYILV